MSDQFVISDISELDINEVMTLEQESGLSPWSSEGYRTLIRKNDSVCLKALDKQGMDDEILGFLVSQMMVADRSISGENSAEIYNICVSQDHRRRGIASALIAEFLLIFEKLAVSSVWIEVRESNLNAIRFYEKFGFEFVETRKNYYSQPLENAAIMVVNIIS